MRVKVTFDKALVKPLNKIVHGPYLGEAFSK